MFHRIQSTTPKDSYILTATFLDGTVKDYDLKPLFVEIPVFNDLNTISGLYEQVHVDVNIRMDSWKHQMVRFHLINSE